MYIQDYYYPTNLDFGITERNEVAILFSSDEQVLSEIKLEGRGTYKKVKAGSISEEFTEKGFLKCQIYRFNGCVIYGVDKASDWTALFVKESDIVEKCKDIWENPDKYSQYQKNTEDAFYQFLKFLWVYKPNQQDIRLVDLVSIRT
jgi:hypothetical protein